VNAVQALAAGEVEAFRRSATANGYRLCRVKTGMKEPAHRNWTHGERINSLVPVSSDSMNTGMICDDLCVFDIDIDDHRAAQRVIDLIGKHLPPMPLVRGRANSGRVAVIFRTSETGSCKAVHHFGQLGKIDILRARKQLVVDGLHPTGARYTWQNNRSPATVPMSAVAAITKSEIDNIFAVFDAAAGEVRAQAPNSAARKHPNGLFEEAIDPSVHPPPLVPAVCEQLGKGVSDGWFAGLAPHLQKLVVEKCLDAIDNTTSDPRPQWMRVVFATADAGRLGCPNARGIALAWSKRGAKWTSESDFETCWNSFRPGGVTVGTLIDLARKSGLNVVAMLGAAPVNSAPAAVPLTRGVADIPAVPRKRHWVHGTDAMRGTVSLLIAPGARGKSSWLLALALACCTGRDLLDAHVFGAPLNVLYVNAEDSFAEIGLRIRAAMRHHRICDADATSLRIAAADQHQIVLLEQDRAQPKLNEGGWGLLVKLVDEAHCDLLILDPLVVFMGGVSLNDNAAAGLLMNRLTRLAVEKDLAAVIAHHASKGRDLDSPDAAMGAVSFVNMARVAKSLDFLDDDTADEIGIRDEDRSALFRIVGTKQNLAPPNSADRLYRLVSIDMMNAELPIYPNGDEVVVVEKLSANASAASGATGPMVFGTSASPTSIYSQPALDAAMQAIAAAQPPFGIRRRNGVYGYVRDITTAVQPVLGRAITERECSAIVKRLLKQGRIVIGRTNVPNPGHGPYERDSLLVAGGGGRSPIHQGTP
jgi:hypothetical protein